MSAHQKISLFIVIIGVSLCTTVNTFAQTQPQISLFSFYGDAHFTQSKDDPLLLNLTIANPIAKSIQKENQSNREMLEQYSQTDDYKALSEADLEKLTEQFPVLEVPQISIGSGSIASIDLIDFQIRNAEGDAVTLNVRPLANNDGTAKSINLNSEEPPYYQFVIESFGLQALPSGDYHIVAVLDTSAQSNMWQGLAFSNTVVVSVTDEHPEQGWTNSNLRYHLNSYYLINDEQFVNAEQQALAWTEQHPNSVDAWAQLGDALFGQGKNDEALLAFETAITKFREKYGNNPPELPELILNRIDEIEGN